MVTTKEEIDRDIRASINVLYSLENQNLSSADVSMILLTSLAMNALIARNKQHTLVEHFDGINEAYKGIFMMLQKAGLEQYLEHTHTREGYSTKTNPR